MESCIELGMSSVGPPHNAKFLECEIKIDVALLLRALKELNRSFGHMLHASESSTLIEAGKGGRSSLAVTLSERIHPTASGKGTIAVCVGCVSRSTTSCASGMLIIL